MITNHEKAFRIADQIFNEEVNYLGTKGKYRVLIIGNTVDKTCFIHKDRIGFTLATSLIEKALNEDTKMVALCAFKFDDNPDNYRFLGWKIEENGDLTSLSPELHKEE